MGKRPFLLAILIFIFSACGSDARNVADRERPRLVQEVTLVATTPASTRFLSPTPSPIVLAVSTSEISSPLRVPTIESNFVLVTPTLPPSKTPTLTPTRTLTFTATPPPTITAPATATSQPGAINVFIPSTAVSINPPSQVCVTPWFFVQPHPNTCPLNAPLASQSSLQQFQQGFMIWVQQQDAIYVLYDSANFPRWEVFQDVFVDGMPESDPALDALAPPYTWQPRRGFGTLWRSNPQIQQRLGWSVREQEEPYNTLVQIGIDGTVYLQDSRGGVITLNPGGADWDRWVG